MPLASPALFVRRESSPAAKDQSRCAVLLSRPARATKGSRLTARGTARGCEGKLEFQRNDHGKGSRDTGLGRGFSRPVSVPVGKFHR
jgi:hypothetical protein